MCRLVDLVYGRIDTDREGGETESETGTRDREASMWVDRHVIKVDRLEKQRRLNNDVDVTVMLRSRQLEYLHEGKLPTSMAAS